MNFQIPSKNFSEKPASEPGLLFSQDRGFLFELDFLVLFAKPVYQNVCIDHRIIFLRLYKMKNHGKLPGRSCFFLFGGGVL